MEGGNQMKLLGIVGVILIRVILLPVMEGNAQEKYLCVPDLITGFRYNNYSKTWEQANFKTDYKYIITRSQFKEYAFDVIKIGDNYPTSLCKEGFKYGVLHCSGTTNFKFNKKNGRYLKTYVIGYWTVDPDCNIVPTDEKSGSPYIEIGKCSLF